MAVLRPLKVVIENYPEGQSEELEAVNHPDDPAAGTRKIRFGREIYVERDDFMENPPKKFFRLSPGKEVRLRYAYFVTCREVVKNAAGEVVELRCTYDPATRGGNAPDGRKVKATLHWVSAADAVPAEVRLYNPLFTQPDPDAGEFRRRPQSEFARSADRRHASSRRSPRDNAGEPVQFERQGYFCPRPGLAAGQAGVQPHRRAARHLGQGVRPRADAPDACVNCVQRACARRAADVACRPVRARASGDRAMADQSRSRADGKRRGGRRAPAAGRPGHGRMACAALARRVGERLRDWALADVGPGRLVPWLADRVRLRHRPLLRRRSRAAALGGGLPLLAVAVVVACLRRATGRWPSRSRSRLRPHRRGLRSPRPPSAR